MAATKGFMHHLSLAACEWFLMFLMFIDAALAFVLTKFAQYCELKTPCLFCLRLDHFFGNEEPGSYLSLFCSKHRAEISSLISCDLHDKLADMREMCDDCFMSMTMPNQSNSESSGTMEGKMRIEGYQRSYLDKNFVRVPSSTGACSCCKRQWKAKSSAQRLVQPSPVGLGASKVTVKPPLQSVEGRSRCSRRINIRRARDKISGTLTPYRVGHNVVVEVDADALSHVGYTELKFNSDPESEVLFSDDDNATLAVAVIGKKRRSKDDSAVIHGMSSQNQDQTRAKHPCSVSDPGPSLPDVHHGESITSHPASLTSNGSIGHGLGEHSFAELQARAVSSPSVPRDTDTTPNQRELSAVDEVKENGPIEVGKDKGSLLSRGSIKDMHSSTYIESDLSNSDGIHDLEASASSDKNDDYESPGASSVSEIEGESVVDKLNRQVEYDRKRLRVLQEELEEERNAADVAANEAMAMITRLQEEKASLHMDALQYLRMMEEQAEYDMEELDKANDIIAEKDKEIQDLEAELEYFRSRYDDELMMGNDMVETENSKGEHMGNGEIDVNSSSDSKSMKVLEARDKPVDVNAPVLDLEDEKKYILQCLLELERKFQQFSSRHTSIGKPNGNVHAERTTNEVENREDLQVDKSDHSQDENILSRHKDSSTSNGTPSTHDISEENKVHVDSSKKRFSLDGGEVDVSTLENEISDLNERLEALEADRDFLEHACNTLQNSGGFQFIQEIAHHLQDLRRIRFDRRCLSVT